MVIAKHPESVEGPNRPPGFAIIRIHGDHILEDPDGHSHQRHGDTGPHQVASQGHHRTERKESRHVHALTRCRDHLVRSVGRLAYPSRAFWLFGLAGVLLDTDHLPRFLSIAFPRLGWQTPPGRFLHWPMVVFLWTACVGLGTLSLGLLAYHLGIHLGNQHGDRAPRRAEGASRHATNGDQGCDCCRQLSSLQSPSRKEATP